MHKNLFTLFCSVLIFTESKSQSVTVLDSTYSVYNYSSTPIDQLYDYSYTQVIYRQTEIQGHGTITSLKYYFGGTSLSNSDSVLVYLGNTSWDEFNYTLGRELVPVARMDSVFIGKLSYNTLPGIVMITLAKPFLYNSDSNLVVAVCEKNSGNNAVINGLWFIGYDGATTGTQLIRNRSSFVDLNPMDPAYVEQHTNQYLGGSGGVAKITLGGLSPFPCQSPKVVHFSNITHNTAKVIWTPPSISSPVAYDIYFSPDRSRPVKASLPKVTVNVPDTQVVITNLLADTLYYAWVRSRCGSADTSVWTYMDSFHTLCAPLPIPTVVEPFSNTSFDWLPHCWMMAYGRLRNDTRLSSDYLNTTTPEPWLSRAWRNISGINYSAAAGFGDTTYQWIVTPTYDLGTSGNKSLEFDISLNRSTNSNQGFLESDDTIAVVISVDNGGTWSRANILQQWVFPQSISGAGQHVSIPLNSYSGNVRIGFYNSSQTLGSLSTLHIVFIDNVQITGVMPVTLLSFTGKKEGPTNLLQWRTATEQNNRGFELQRAAQAPSIPQGGSQESTFSTIAFVPTKANGGSSNAELAYSYYDKKPPSGGRGAYYRLKQLDNDGKATISDVVLIKGEPATELFLTSLYPNPTKQLLNVVLEAPLLQRVQLVITDLAGKTVKQQTFELQKGTNNKTVNVVTLAKGTYMVKIICFDGCEAAVRKFVKE